MLLKNYFKSMDYKRIEETLAMKQRWIENPLLTIGVNF